MTDIKLSQLHTPSPISSLAFGSSESNQLVAGSDDGSLRVYDLSALKVLKAIRGLGSEVSSIAAMQNGENIGDIFLACGRRILSFQMDSPKMILTLTDATMSLEVGEDDDDDLNELALNSAKTQLAFSSDAGGVGVVDLSTKKVTRMKKRHESICGTVKFIPNRRSELVSGGYDLALLHFDFLQGSVLSRRDLAALPFLGGMTLSPPFIMTTCLSSTGVIAAGTADGRLFLGFGGEKRGVSIGKKKRTRKWGGLDERDELFTKIAEGPIVSMVFTDPTTILLSTMLGNVTQYRIDRDEAEGIIVLVPTWKRQTEQVAKVNALNVKEKLIVIGGLDKEGKGAIEIWDQSVVTVSDANTELTSLSP